VVTRQTGRPADRETGRPEDRETEGDASWLRLALFTDTYPPQINGVARTLERLVRAIEARGGAVHVVTVEDPAASPDGTVSGAPRAPGSGLRTPISRWPSVPFWAYPQLRVSAPARMRALDVIERFRPTLVHAATEFGVGLGALVAAREARVPLVTSYHTHFEQYIHFYRLSFLNAIAWPYLRWFHNSGLRTFVPSGVVARELEAHGVRGVRVWGRGVELDRFHPRFRSADCRARLGANDGTLLVAYVGRLAPEKGIDVALAGMRLALERQPGRVVFALAGDGPAEARCRASAPPGTVFTGRLVGRALSEFYASADVLVFPSLTETFGNVVLEAMASELALIAPDEGATTELATSERALQFPARDPAALAACVERLLHDDSLRRRLAAAALAEARERTWDRVFDRLLADYREVAARI